MAFDFPSSPTVGQQFSPVPGTTYTYNGYGWALATGAVGLIAPQGRLTLQTGVPVMTTTQSAKTTIYYTPYCGNLCPIYDGTNFSMSAFSEMSAITTDTTKSPAAIGASKVNDWFVWNDAGTLRLGHGPDWTSDTVRSAGTALVMVAGILLNSVAITNGPAASRGTYVGTTYSTVSSQLTYDLGSTAAGGGAAFVGVWNAYNRVNQGVRVRDSTGNWTRSGSAGVTADYPATGTRAAFVIGLAEDPVDMTFHVRVTTSGAGNTAQMALSLNSTANPPSFVNANVGTTYSAAGALIVPTDCRFLGYVLGFNTLYAMEYADSATFYGDPYSGIFGTIRG